MFKQIRIMDSFQSRCECFAVGEKLTTVDCMPMPMLVRHIARLYRFLFRFDNH